MRRRVANVEARVSGTTPAGERTHSNEEATRHLCYDVKWENIVVNGVDAVVC